MIRKGRPRDEEEWKKIKCGTKLARGASFSCLVSKTPIAKEYIRSEFRAKRNGYRMMAVVAEGKKGRVYLSPTSEMEKVAEQAQEQRKKEYKHLQIPFIYGAGERVRCYGIESWHELFTPRQLVALNTFSDLIPQVRERVLTDAQKASRLSNDGKSLEAGGTGATAYADAIAVYLTFVVDKCAAYGSSVCTWHNTGEKIQNVFARQAIPMTWDMAETNPFSGSSGNFISMLDWVWKALERTPAKNKGYGYQEEAGKNGLSKNKIISTDPPYYDNIAYADISDFFYIWMRKSLKPLFPNLFPTMTVPKKEELVAFAHRHSGDKKAAKTFFMEGMKQVLSNLFSKSHPFFPITIYYAFKQSETKGDSTTSTGWEAFLEAVVESGLSIDGTWPMRTELSSRSTARGTNALASSIVLVCQKRPPTAIQTTRREFMKELKAELPLRLRDLKSGYIPPVDLAQASIGPGIALFSKYKGVLEANGSKMTVGEALSLINQVLEEHLAEDEGDYDKNTKWAIHWFEQFAFNKAEYGSAETMTKAKNTSIDGLKETGIIEAQSGKVRLYKPEELRQNKNSIKTVWGTLHFLVVALDKEGEEGAAKCMSQVSRLSPSAKDLAYRLYSICNRKKWSEEAQAYNSIIQSWPEIERLANNLSKEDSPPVTKPLDLGIVS